MSTPMVAGVESGPALDVPVLDVVLPVHDEEAGLAAAVARLHDHLAELPWTFRITIADNASTDATALVAHRLSHEYDEVRTVTLPEKGRGRALKKVWSASASPVLLYMDVDLSTDLNALLPLVAPVLSGHSDVAIGTRLSRGSRTSRGPRRELISRGYNLLLRGTLRTGFRDAQCGFKAIRADVARELLPLVRDDTWFFDTELLVLAERAGLRIHEVPAARSLGTQVALFAVVGVASTAAYALLYLLLRLAMGPFWANALALLATAVANTSANRRLTFGVRGRRHAVRHQLQGLVILGAGLGVTSASLWLLDTVDPGGHAGVEVAVLTVANLLVTVMRFVAMRLWVFVRRSPAP